MTRVVLGNGVYFTADQEPEQIKRAIQTLKANGENWLTVVGKKTTYINIDQIKMLVDYQVEEKEQEEK